MSAPPDERRGELAAAQAGGRAPVQLKAARRAYACMKRKATEALASPPPPDGCGTPQRATQKRRRYSAVTVVQTLLTRFFGYLPRPAPCAHT